MCRNKKLHEVEHTDAEEIILYTVNNDLNSREWNVNIQINDEPIICKIDTGAQVNVIPVSCINRRKRKNIQINPTNIKLTGYGGNKIEVMGKVTVRVKYKNKRKNVDFYVTNSNNDKPLLGLPTCEEFGIITITEEIKQKETKDIDDIKEKYKDIFEGLGCVPHKYDIKIDPNAIPKISQPRKIPLNLRNQLKAELGRMCKLKVIEKVSYPTEWLNPIVIVEKPGKQLRICLDPRELNKAIKREHYQLPTVEEIASRLAGAQVFSTLDANSGF